MRIAIYDAQLREVKELYRQPWFQQRQGQGFSTVLLGDRYCYLRYDTATNRWAVHVTSVPDDSPKSR